MAVVAGRNRVNRPYFFRDKDGDRVEFPSFGTGQGELVGNELRMFNMLVSAKQIELASAVAPEAFVAGDWSVSGDTVTIINLPDDNGVDMTGIAIRVDGTDVTIVDPVADDYPLGLDPGTYDIDIAAVSAAGQSAWSDVKQTVVS